MLIGRYVPLWTKIVNGVSLVSSQASYLLGFRRVITHALHRTFGTPLEVSRLLVADGAGSLMRQTQRPQRPGPVQSNRRK